MNSPRTLSLKHDTLEADERERERERELKCKQKETLKTLSVSEQKFNLLESITFENNGGHCKSQSTK